MSKEERIAFKIGRVWKTGSKGKIKELGYIGGMVECHRYDKEKNEKKYN